MKNSKLKTQNSKLIPRAFTLVELMIVVSILGILAAVVIPEFQNHQQKAKETQAKANLKLLREAIERYKMEHNGIYPGFINGEPTVAFLTSSQLVNYSNIHGDFRTIKTGEYNLGPYLNKIPKNPFNGESYFTLIGSEGFPSEASETTGWYYKPSTGEIRLNKNGNDSEGVPFSNY